MQTISELSDDDGIEAERVIIRKGLSEIVQEVGTRMREGGLSYPVYLTIPNSGDALALMATPLDLANRDWDQVTKIIREIVSQRLGGTKLRSRELICSAANITIAAAEVTAD